MTLRLSIDAPRWRSHMDGMVASTPGLVPVVKGDGYGLGASVVARECARMGVDAVAVGTPAEAEPLISLTRADVVVLQPWAPRLGCGDPRIIRTIGRCEALRETAALARPPRVIVELDSPVHRHGLSMADLAESASILRGLPLAGYSLHLPMNPTPRRLPRVITEVLTGLARAGAPQADLWVSHVDETTMDRLSLSGHRLRRRVGTRLWLGDRAALEVSGEVLDVHSVPVGARVGYRQTRWPGGTMVVVSGGTSQGIGVHADAGGRGFRRMRQTAAALRDASGAGPSPFVWGGRRLRFADVAHMQVSMLVVPPGVTPPRVGQRLPAAVRLTTTRPDEVVLTEGRPVALAERAAAL